jgi:hypothetical protein
MRISAVNVFIAGRRFRRGDEIPDQYAAKCGPHCFADGGDSDDNPSAVPPKTGKGSGKEAWGEYAATAAPEVEIPEDASRDDIIAALEGAGIPTAAE